MVSQQEIEFYKSIITDLDIVFDVGCQHDNIFDELKPGMEVHLFDPVKSNQLLDKIAGRTNIHYNNFALGNVRTTLPFHPAYSSILKREDEIKFTDHHEIIIDVDTGYNYCKREKIKHIDLLKIDTEGFDYKVILGCGSMLRNIKYIQFEHWDNEQTAAITQYLQLTELITLHSKPINFVARL